MKVRIKKLKEGAMLPKKATAGAAAYDLYIPEETIVKHGRHIIPLGFAMEVPENYEALIDARSGFSSKGMEGHHVMADRTVFGDQVYYRAEPSRYNCDVIQGKIDSDYRGCVGVIVNNLDVPFMVKAGTRIAQLTFVKVASVSWDETDELSETDREGGFGSTGTK